MKLRTTYYWSIITVIVGVLVSCQSSDQVDFSTQIKPLLNKNCISCHGGVKKSGGFSVLFEEEAFAITKSGKPAIIPGDAANSEFIKRLHSDDSELRMPYEKPKLSDADIALLTKWIDQGAKWGEHWAYSLPDKVAIPKHTDQAGFNFDANPNFIKNDIDYFIAETLERELLTPSPAAAKEIIGRRVAIDITGIPPTQELMNRYLTNEISYENFVDTLLTQKTYGENWASWWLDMARYSDTKGYEKDMGRFIYEFRDWVIKALNKDMPFNDFTTQQLAGDLLPNPTTDQLIATAFHRNTMSNDEGGTEDEEFRVASVIDRVNTTFEVWQSTTMGCVQCHSHPYDPITNKEYYNAMAFFNNTRDEDLNSEGPVLRFFNDQEKQKLTEIKSWLTKYGSKNVAKKYSDFLSFTEPVYNAHSFTDFTNGSYDDHAVSNLWNNGSCVLKNVSAKNFTTLYLKCRPRINKTQLRFRKNNSNGEILAETILNKASQVSIISIPFKNVPETFDLFVEVMNPKNTPKDETILNIFWMALIEDLPGKKEAGYPKIKSNIIDILKSNSPTVPILVENPKEMRRTTQVFGRGNWLVKEDTVQPGTPKSLNEWNTDWPKNRLGLSKWLVSKKNPLTARTLVNRVWNQIYGRGLVETVEDMGSQSSSPSHPALLDWLALRFMNEHNWSIKALLKEIVLSGTYRQQSNSSPQLTEKDPKNKWYARGPRTRLTAEQIRDQALAVSGLLSDRMYGPGVMPPQPDGVWQTVYSNQVWLESRNEDKYRRAVYTYLKRTSPYPSFITFDAGSREVCTIRRTVTNTPLQALVTLNDPVYVEAAYKLAELAKDESIEVAIAKMYKQALFLTPSDEKVKALNALYQTALAEFEHNPEGVNEFLKYGEAVNKQTAALTIVANAILNLDEFLSKA